MPAPSQLSIATSSVNRLVKEEASYHKELEQQQARIDKLEQGGGDENAEYTMKQEKQALEETRRVLPSLKQRISDAVAALEEQLEAGKESGNPGSVEEITKAKEAVAAARKGMREIA